MTTQELDRLISTFRSLPPSEERSLEETRANMVFLEDALPVPDDAVVEPIKVNGVNAEWVSAPGAAAESSKALLYLHGGGYAFCGPGTHRLLAYNLSAAAGMRCLLLDYRLAPEHPFPAAVDDAQAAYQWLLSEGYPAGGLAVAGDSAGGGLTLATVLRLREHGQPLPAAMACISPWTDLTMSGASIDSKAADDPLVSRITLNRCADWYLGDTAPDNPLASPLLADLSGLPPTLIHVGSEEVLLDDAARLAERATEAGVAVDYQCWERMFHVWHLYAPMLSEGRDAVENIGTFLSKHVD